MKRFLLCLVLIPLFFKIAVAQNKVSGTIRDSETSEGIPGASVIIKGKLTGTVTDGEGNFELNTVVKPPFVLIVSVINYQKQEIEVTGTDALSVSMVPSAEILNEVVFSASRVEESILESPVSIEKMDTRAIRE